MFVEHDPVAGEIHRVWPPRVDASPGAVTYGRAPAHSSREKSEPAMEHVGQRSVGYVQHR